MSRSPGPSVNSRSAVSLEQSAPQRSVVPLTSREVNEHDSDLPPQPADTVLVLRWDNSRIDEFLRFLEEHGFEVHCAIGPDQISDRSKYGAIIHLARSDNDLRIHLGSEFDAIANEEWVLLAGDGEQDFHCTFQITQQASDELRAFVHWLWAIGSVA